MSFFSYRRYQTNDHRYQRYWVHHYHHRFKHAVKLLYSTVCYNTIVHIAWQWQIEEINLTMNPQNNHVRKMEQLLWVFLSKWSCCTAAWLYAVTETCNGNFVAIAPKIILPFPKSNAIPAGTRRNNNVFITSKRRRRRRFDVVKTLSLRRYCVMCPLGWIYPSGATESSSEIQYVETLCGIRYHGQHWSRWYLGTCVAPSHYLNQWGLIIN